MGSPGEIEHVPLKVVPMYVEPENPEAPAPEETEPPEIQVVAKRPRTPFVGIAALAVAVVTAVVHGVAVGVASGGDLSAGTVLAVVAICLSVLAVVGGLVALIGGFGRRWGVAAIVLGALANPVVLLALLGWVQSIAS
ncbi:MAG: 1,4-dihydroxy-6-naphthoate synthase [Solirubrobacteraceae bacterium]